MAAASGAILQRLSADVQGGWAQGKPQGYRNPKAGLEHLCLPLSNPLEAHTLVSLISPWLSISGRFAFITSIKIQRGKGTGTPLSATLSVQPIGSTSSL